MIKLIYAESISKMRLHNPKQLPLLISLEAHTLTKVDRLLFVEFAEPWDCQSSRLGVWDLNLELEDWHV